MARHWKVILWLSVAVIALTVAAFATKTYFFVIALVYASAIIAFVLTASWMEEGRPARRRAPARRGAR